LDVGAQLVHYFFDLEPVDLNLSSCCSTFHYSTAATLLSRLRSKALQVQGASQNPFNRRGRHLYQTPNPHQN
jgi:hypothetical protein